MKYRKLILSIVTTMACITAHAMVATWAVLPNNQKIQRFTKNWFLIQNNGKWGVINVYNDIVLPASYDYITSFINGYSLVGVKDGTKYLLQGILREDGTFKKVSGSYFLSVSRSHDYSYFSEEKLVVYNKNGKFGYINPTGEIVVNCQFDNALPFKGRYAPVKQGNYMIYIDENYDKNKVSNTLIVDFHYGEMTVAGCFKNGFAPVAYNTDYALINNNGQKIRKIKELEFNNAFKVNAEPPEQCDNNFNTTTLYSSFSENGKFGLKLNENIIIAPQFDSFGEQFSDGYIIATLDNKQGIIKLSDGEVEIKSIVKGSSTSKLEYEKNGNLSPITIECIIPATHAGIRILLDDGRGILSDMTSSFSKQDSRYSCTYTPKVQKGVNTLRNRVIVENGGILLAQKDFEYTIHHKVKLRLSISGTREARANENDLAGATVTAKIINDSQTEIKVTATWSTGKKTTLNIPANGSAVTSINVSESNVQSVHSRTYSLSLSSGERASWTVTYSPFW